MAIHYRTVVSSDFCDRIEKEVEDFQLSVYHGVSERREQMHADVEPEAFTKLLRQTWPEVIRPDFKDYGRGSVISINEDSDEECLRGFGLGPRIIHLWSKTS